MRLAFLAATAQIQCRVQGRRHRQYRPRSYRRRRRRSVLFLKNILDSIFDLDAVQISKRTYRLKLRTFARSNHYHRPNHNFSVSSSTFLPFDPLSPSLSPKAIIRTSTIGGSNAWPFLAFWHLASLILFLFTTLTCSVSSTALSNMDTTDRVGKSWTPSTDLEWSTARAAPDSYLDRSMEMKYLDDDEDNSCSLLEYFLSPSRYSQSSSSNSNIVRRSVDDASSTFSGPPNSDIDNVFAIWLRASRSGGSDDEETSWPLQRPRTRHRYQHYRNPQSGNAISSRKDQSSSAATRRPRVNSTSRNRPISTSPSPSKGLTKKPILRPHQKQSPKQYEYPQCKLFDEHSVEELCALEVSKRVEALRYVYTKSSMGIRGQSNDLNSNTNSNSSSVLLYDLFALGIYSDAQKSRPRVSHLANSLRPCIISAPSKPAGENNATNQKDPCRTCYRNLLDHLRDIDSRHEAFTQSVLSMIDCEPDNDLEQFSPTSNCSECKLWYKRWLLVIFSHIWRQKPCLQWCHLAELACPHLPPVRKHDYAGLPSFRCTDPEISSVSARNSTYGPPCDCVHPCDTEAHTVQWGWDISSELSDFCRDYRKRDKSECGQKKKTSGRASTKTGSRSSASQSRMDHWLIWFLKLAVIRRLLTMVVQVQ